MYTGRVVQFWDGVNHYFIQSWSELTLHMPELGGGGGGGLFWMFWDPAEAVAWLCVTAFLYCAAHCLPQKSSERPLSTYTGRAVQFYTV
jgi:hypothetical protein